MASEAVPQLLDVSVDSAGLSVVSAIRTAADPRNGTMYNPLVLAAGVPVWFHPLQTGQYIGLLRSHWFNATVGTGGPQSYSAHTEGGSVWVKVTPPGGQTEVLGKIRDGLTLNGACSRKEFLFTVGSLDDGTASVQHHRIGPGGALMSVDEDILPVTNGVLFDKGCYIDDEYLVVLGTDADAKVYMARRKWFRIGARANYREDALDKDTDEERAIRIYDVGVEPWEYQGLAGWLSDPFHLEPIGLTSVGPVSVAMFRGRLVASTVALDAGEYVARVYQTRAADPFGKWKPDPLGEQPLGNIDTNLGGALYFQSQLGRNPAAPVPVEGSMTAIPYVTSARSIAGSEHAITTAWGLWSIRSTV